MASSFKPLLKPSLTKAREMPKKIGAFITRSLQPYSVVEEPSFLDMIYAVRFWSTSAVSHTVVPNLYATKKNAFGHNGGAECITRTTDGWTSRAADRYMCVRAHMMESNFRQPAYALACETVPQEHTGENIVPFLRDVPNIRACPTTSRFLTPLTTAGASFQRLPIPTGRDFSALPTSCSSAEMMPKEK